MLRFKPLKVAVTAIPLPTSEPANVPAVAEPVKFEVSPVIRPEAITGVPVKTAMLPVSYTLLDAVRPLTMTGARVISLAVFAS